MIELSVIIPVYNSPGGLAATLEALVGQSDIGADRYEIIVIDNNSTDDTGAVAERFVRRWPGLISVVREPVQGSYAARNRGIDAATGDLLCFLDADVIPEEGYLSRVLRAFEGDGIDYAGANVTLERSGYGFFEDYDAVTGFPVRANLEGSQFAPTCCLSVRRAVIDSVGEFDSRLESGGDVEFGKRVHRAGFRQRFLDEVHIVHPARRTFSALAQKKRRVGRGNAQLRHFHPETFQYKSEGYSLGNLLRPHNPATLRQVSRERGYSFSLARCTFLAMLAIPLNIIGYIAFRGERKRLQQTSGS